MTNQITEEKNVSEVTIYLEAAIEACSMKTGDTLKKTSEVAPRLVKLHV